MNHPNPFGAGGFSLSGTLRLSASPRPTSSTPPKKRRPASTTPSSPVIPPR